ncbi:trigger factor-like protein TIG, Chloroplastic [Chenopodium quinoa]|uniref:peptidylprolyl isomerase n=1 Tax=Chenopodium quinoa TaxID=63459 RepID=A0A803LXZ1_CHEQI|nr:trigger factor-like protein TIG, Chloroplastic [Chenopodium quinoa]
MSSELWSSAISMNLSFHTRSSSFSFLPTNNFHPLHLNKSNNTLYKFLHFSPSSRQFSALQHQLSKAPTHLSASSSASSSTANAEKEDKLPADIDITEITEPNSRVKLTVSVPSVVCEDCYKKVMQELSKQAKVPGFRPGKQVPDSILLSYAGKRNVERATIESILKRTLPHALSSVNEIALQDSVRIITSFAELEKMYASSNSLKFDIVVDVMPEVRWNPEDGYKNLKIVVEIDNEITAEVACERELKRRHKTLGPMRIVTDRGLQVGDVVVVDISAATLEEGGKDSQKIPSAESKGFNFDTEDAETVLPGFLDSIIGIRQGETKSFPLVFPESWKQEDLRGVQAQFTVECKELFYRELPPLDDSLAEQLLPGCSTLEEVREALLQRCRELEKTAKDQATDNAILDQIRKMVEVDIPQSLYEEEGRQMFGSKLLEVQAQMKLSDEQLASLTNPKTVSDYIEQEKENINQIIKQNLAVGDIFKRENLQVSTDEVVKEVENSIAEFKKHQQEYDEEGVRGQVEEVLEGAKVLEWLREHAEIQYIIR